MGRFYSGNIHGKFWVAVQSTYCMEEYGATFDGLEYDYAICPCRADGEDDGTDFCHRCFESREEHLKAIEDDGEESNEQKIVEKDECDDCEGKCRADETETCEKCAVKLRIGCGNNPSDESIFNGLCDDCRDEESDEDEESDDGKE